MKADTKYYELGLFGVPSSKEDEVSVFFIENGALGVSHKLDYVQPDLVYDPEIIKKPTVDLNCYFEHPPKETLLKEFASEYPGIKFEVYERETQDWMEGWKKHFKPFQLSGDYWVVPSWLEVPKEAKRALRIDPGMAFGTGTHATTQIASEFLAGPSLALRGSTALDVGTGTGILALIMSGQGCAVVHATEIDEMARDTAKENIELNKPNTVNILDEQIDTLQGQYDVVVANIIDGVIVKLRHDLYRLTKPGGLLVLTGILEERKDWFLDEFSKDFNLVKILNCQKDEWVGYVLKKGALP